jgi:hypothetical protein
MTHFSHSDWHGSRFWLTSQGLILLCVVFNVFMLAASDSAKADGTGGPQAVTARLQGIQRFTFKQSGQREAVQIGSFRFDNQDTVLALSLEKGLPLNPSATWVAGDPVTMGLRGLRSSMWIAEHGSSSGAPLTNQTDELLAEQYAVWAYTDGLKLTRSAIPSAAIWKRARELVTKAASAPAKVNILAYGVGISALLTDVSPTTVTLSVQLTGSGGHPFSNPQSITMYANGRSAAIKTTKQTYVDTNRPGKNLVARITGAAPDTDTAIVQVPRNAATMEVAFDWNIQFIPPLILLPNTFGTPPIMTTRPVPLDFRTNIILDPSQYPSLTGLLNNKALALIGGLHGWQGWAVLILLLWLVPLASRGVTALLVGGTKGGVALVRKQRRAEAVGPDKSPDKTSAKLDEQGSIRARDSEGKSSTSNPIDGHQKGSTGTPPDQDNKQT